MSGFVTLVGAGCGPGLITLTGVQALQSAEVILYDDLLDEGLLSEYAAEADRIYVGKRKGQHSASQDNINRLLVEHASAGKRVVRLKGGDSYVFGRGGEEALALQEAGIPYDVIPGVSSAIAVPEHLGIPVTHRGVARSFTVVTGHTALSEDGNTVGGEDYEALAKLQGTLVFLMGLHNMETICEKLVAFGKDPATPACVLSCGHRKDELRVDGTLSTISEKAAFAGAKTPAILVVGDTAGLDLRSIAGSATPEPSITVIGTEGFCRRFREKCPGAKTVPMVSITPIPGVVEDLLPSLAGTTWLGFLSGNAIEQFFASVPDLRALAHLKFACVGSATEKALAKHGFVADFVPSRFDRDTLVAELSEKLSTEDQVVLLGAAQSAAIPPEDPRFRCVGLYETITAPGSVSVDTDYVVFASGSGVRGFFEQGGTLNGALPVCIGNATAAELQKYVAELRIAHEHTIDGILHVIQENTP